MPSTAPAIPAIAAATAVAVIALIVLPPGPATAAGTPGAAAGPSGAAAGTAAAPEEPAMLTADQAARLAALALDCVRREYPNKIAHVMTSDADVAPPRELYPAFHGCFDWHSAVHGHWLLARFARLFPDHPLAADATAVLDAHLTPARMAGEVAYLTGPDRDSWERPYGLAWLLQLATELHEWDDPGARRWSAALQPLADACVARLSGWLPKLTYPIRTGEHSQTAFAFGLMLDHARACGRTEFATLVETTTGRLYREDRGASLAFEPSGQDFLSPALAEADLLRRVLPAEEYGAWLAGFLPGLPGTPVSPGSSAGGAPAGGPPGGPPERGSSGRAAPDADPAHPDPAGWLPVATVSDRADGKLAHLDGLNLSRAWMLQGMAAGLPAGDPRRPALHAAAAAHARSGLAACTGEHYAGGHWLGTFAMYLVSDRGLAR